MFSILVVYLLCIQLYTTVCIFFHRILVLFCIYWAHYMVKITKFIIDIFINIITIIIIIIDVIIILWLTGHSYHRTFEVCLQRRRVF